MCCDEKCCYIECDPKKTCCQNCKICCRQIKIKRYFLPFVLGPGALIYEGFQNYVYIPVFLGIAAFFLFWNFPWIVYYTASKPLYYQDIFIDEKKLPNYNVNVKIKQKFECIFVWVLIVTNTLLVGGLAEYWLFKSLSDQTIMQILGTTGGIIKIFQIVNNTICRIMLKILKKYVKNENKKFEQLQNQRIKSIINLKKESKISVLDIVESQLEQKSFTRDRGKSF